MATSWQGARTGTHANATGSTEYKNGKTTNVHTCPPFLRLVASSVSCHSPLRLQSSPLLWIDRKASELSCSISFIPSCLHLPASASASAAAKKGNLIFCFFPLVYSGVAPRGFFSLPMFQCIFRISLLFLLRHLPPLPAIRIYSQYMYTSPSVHYHPAGKELWDLDALSSRTRRMKGSPPFPRKKDEKTNTRHGVWGEPST